MVGIDYTAGRPGYGNSDIVPDHSWEEAKQKSATVRAALVRAMKSWMEEENICSAQDIEANTILPTHMRAYVQSLLPSS